MSTRGNQTEEIFVIAEGRKVERHCSATMLRACFCAVPFFLSCSLLHRMNGRRSSPWCHRPLAGHRIHCAWHWCEPECTEWPIGRHCGHCELVEGAKQDTGRLHCTELSCRLPVAPFLSLLLLCSLTCLIVLRSIKRLSTPIRQSLVVLSSHLFGQLKSSRVLT